MSLRSLANEAAARRRDVGPANTAPRGLSEIAAAASTPPERASDDAQKASGVDTALNLLIGYVPTEIVTMYLAFIAALQPAGNVAPTGATRDAAASYQAEWITFLVFLLATPLAFWAIHIGKLRVAAKPVAREDLPLWEPIAAMIAFSAWAFAIPNSPFRAFEDWYSPGVAALIAVAASTVLGLAAPVFQRPLGAGPAPPAGDLLL